MRCLGCIARMQDLLESEISENSGIMLHGCPPMMLGAETLGPRFNTITLRDSRLHSHSSAGPLRHLGQFFIFSILLSVTS